MNSIETINLTKKYKNIVAVDNLNLIINKGELYSLLGVNGAGKTTTIKMLTCLLKPSNGDAQLNGKSIIKNMQEVKEIINVSPQETAVAPNLTVLENLEFIAGVYNIKDKKSKVDELIKQFKLESVLKQRAKTLSGGYARRLSIAMSLINNPEILFLDEPTLGLDVLARRELWKVIESLKGKITIILTTHYMEEAEMLSNHIGIIRDGKLLISGTKEELMNKANTDKFEDAFVKLATEVDIDENN